MLALAVFCLGLALLPLVLGLCNLTLYRRPREAAPSATQVSILIPARDEEETIGQCVRAALASTGVEIEVIVLDDHSSDGTAGIVRALAAEDARVRLEHSPPLPPGWSGKQHACQVLGERARFPLMLFLDADVRITPDAVSKAAGFLLARDIGLASGFPRERTVSWGERLLIPMIHLLLLGYLPMALMRRRLSVGLGAGCGQLIIVRAEAWRRAGGHAAIRCSMHDGVMLPRAFRRSGSMTDLFDATDLASCRMYDGFAAVWSGFSKNATEGMATASALPVWTLLLAGGHIVAWAVLPLAAVFGASGRALVVLAAAVLANLALRAALAVRFRQSIAAIPLHPVSVALMLALQWLALIRARSGKPVRWRDRSYPPS
ncbi:MAG: glycosyltransferase [Rhodospirillales bacterium]